MLPVAIALAACGATPPPKAPGLGGPPVDLAAAARRCALVASCADAHDPAHLRNPTACVDWWLTAARDEPALTRCLGAAASCKDALRCTHDASDAAAAAFCAAHPGTLGACDGARLYGCSDDPAESTASDCAALGGTCVERHVAGGLVVRGCTSARLCPPGAPAERCEDGAVVRCEDDMADRRACPEGRRCVVRDDAGEPLASCEGERGPGRAARCAKPGYAACDGDTATFCALAGKDAWLRSQDCAALGLGCVVRAGRAVCAARGGTCASAEARCEEGALVFCAAAREMRVSCKDIGFSRCDPAARGQEAGCR